MSELFKTLDSYGDLLIDKYFTYLYDSISSHICAQAEINASKTNVEKLIQFIGIEDGSYEIVFKKLKNNSSKTPDLEKDYPVDIVYQHKRKKCIISFDISRKQTDVEFYFDATDKELEQEILALHHKIRSEYGYSKSPSFNVLIKTQYGFDVEPVKTEPVNLDIDKHYNDDFKEEYQIITSALEEKKSGVILLYGKPGTGKSTLIKNFISKNVNANFIFIQNEFVQNLLDPDFASFFLRQKDSILIIEDAEKVLKSRESNSGASSVVSNILQLTDGLFSDFLNIKIICTFNTSLTQIDSALLRKGRMISKYEFKELELEKTNALLQELNFKTSDKPLTISEIFNRNKKDYNIPQKNKMGF